MNLPNFKSLPKSVWFVLGGTVIIITVWIAVIIPALGRLQNTAQAIIDTQGNQASSVEATRNLIAALQQKTLLEDQAQQLDQVFIDQANPVAFVSRLEELGNDHDLTLDINLQEPSTTVATPVTETAVSINAAGNLIDTLDFLNDLLTEPTFLKVTSLDFTTPSSSTGVVNLHLETLSYWRSYVDTH